MATVSLGYDGYSQSLSPCQDVVRGRQNSCGDSSSSSGDDSSWSDWEAETDGHQVRPPVVKVSGCVVKAATHVVLYSYIRCSALKKTKKHKEH